MLAPMNTPISNVAHNCEIFGMYTVIAETVRLITSDGKAIVLSPWVT